MNADLVSLYKRFRQWGWDPRLSLRSARARLASPIRVGESHAMSGFVTHTMGPFSLFTARDVSALLSEKAVNERWISTGRGTVYVLVEVPEGLTHVWRVA